MHFLRNEQKTESLYIGSIANRDEFFSFLKNNSDEINSILDSHFEKIGIKVWDELDIDLEYVDGERDATHHVTLGTRVETKRALDSENGKDEVTIIHGRIYCIHEDKIDNSTH